MKNIPSVSKFLVFLVLISMSSCSIEKRMYLPGYNISFHKKIKNKNEFKKSDKVEFSQEKEVNVKKAEEAANSEIKLSSPIASVIDEPSMALTTQKFFYDSVSAKTYPNEIYVKKDVKVKKAKYTKRNIINSNVQNQENRIAKVSSDKEVKPKNERKAAIIKGGSLILMAIIALISVPFLGTLTDSIGLVAILLLDILVSFGIIKYYKKTKPKLAKLTGISRLIYSAIFGIGIGYHIAGNVLMFNMFWQIGLIGFGVHLITLGILFNNEGCKKWVNIAIKSLLIVAGVGYIIFNTVLLLFPNAIAFAALIKSIFILPMILGEISFALWMIFKGGKKSKIQ